MTSFTEYTALEYLKIDIATNYGDTDINGETVDLDKVDFEDRINWFNQQEKAGNLAGLIHTADKPALYFAGLKAYADTLDGKAIGYPISLDACSSGLQILAVLANCEKSARRCGVIDTGHREDAYSTLFADMKVRSATRLRASRSELKQAIMTALYGSTAMPKILFGEGSPTLDLFYEIIENEIPGAWELNLSLKGLWQPYATEHSWTLPDGFEVEMTVDEVDVTEIVFMGGATPVYTKQAKGTPKGRSLSPNIVHSIDGMIVREMMRRCSFDESQVTKLIEVCNVAMRRTTRRDTTKGKGRQKDILLSKIWKNYLNTGFLSARVIDLVDENNISLISAHKLNDMLMTLPVKSFPMLAVHDCFRAHPNYGNDVRRQYNHILSSLAKSDILSDLATQITGSKKEFIKVGDIGDQIINANYTLS